LREFAPKRGLRIVRTAPEPGDRYNPVLDSGHKELSLPHPDLSTHGLPLKDEATIATLAHETDTDAALVKDLYAEELAILQTQASVKNFIGVIAARRVRQRIASARRHGRPVKTRAA
jgi:hypothetical protein